MSSSKQPESTSRGIAGMHTDIENAASLPKLKLELNGAVRDFPRVVCHRHLICNMPTDTRRIDSSVTEVFQTLDMTAVMSIFSLGKTFKIKNSASTNNNRLNYGLLANNNNLRLKVCSLIKRILIIILHSWYTYIHIRTCILLGKNIIKKAS